MKGDPADEVPQDLVDLGIVRGAYGVKGWVRIQPFDAQATVLGSTRGWWLRAPAGIRRVQVTGSRPHAGLLVAKWIGFEQPEPIDALKGATVAVPRSAFPVLPDGEYYWTDLIGARVLNRQAQELGTVTALANNGAQDLLQVDGSAGTLLVPMVPAYVDAVDVAARVIRVDWEADWS